MHSRAEAPSFLYLPELPAPGATTALERDDAHYLTRVCRMGPGERARATDGRGRVALLEITAAGPPLEVRALEVVTVERRGEAWILCGAPEGQRADWMVEKLAELGVARLHPVEAGRARWRGRRLDRWRKLAIAALRQSQQAYMLEVLEPMSLSEALGAVPAGASRWLGSMEGAGGSPPATELVVGAIGPAEGWSAAERARLDNDGYQPLRLAEGRLRTETAAIAWAAWWAARRPAGR